MTAPSPRPVVYKFGGSSLADAGRILHVADLVVRGPRPLVVVVSALQGVTDLLAALPAAAGDAGERRRILQRLRERHLRVMAGLELDAHASAHAASFVEERLARVARVLSAAHPEGAAAAAATLDAILSAGEDLSARLLAAVLGRTSRTARVVDARTVVRTDDRHGRAVPDPDAIRELCGLHLPSGPDMDAVWVTQGFVGATARGRTTTLGRGGSDFSAALLGAGLDAEMVHVWTDVPGVLSGDPATVGAPRLLAEIGFEEAVELAWSGARVIHPVAAKWAVSRGVPLRIRSTFEPDHPGTLIRNDVRGAAEIAAVTAKRNVALIEVRSRPWALPYGFLARVFGVLARHRLEVDLVATSHSSTAFTIDAGEELGPVVRELSECAEVRARTALATVTVVGRGLLEEPGMDALVFWAVEKTPVHLISQASDVSLSFVVDEEETDALLRRLHLALIETRAAAARRSA